MKSQKKLTKKQETFVDLMVYQDYNQTKCAHLAGYENPGVAATRLLSNPEYEHVQFKIKQLKAIQRKKNEITYEGIAKKLADIRDVALADGSYGPAVTAEIARAKLAGLMIDKKELKIHKIDSMNRDQLEARLQELVKENQIILGQAEEVKPSQCLQDLKENHPEVEDVEVSETEEDLDQHQEESD